MSTGRAGYAASAHGHHMNDHSGASQLATGGMTLKREGTLAIILPVCMFLSNAELLVQVRSIISVQLPPGGLVSGRKVAAGNQQAERHVSTGVTSADQRVICA